ncbi:MAG TPA: ATP-binding protein [Solirubrobacteraceae bacterium]|nr:ATP-binding protein [Solirubrobacteraceae bacterium]
MSAAEQTDGHASPYLGLRPFEAEDASFFFGRHSEVDLLVANLRTARTSLVYGQSGVGKSSLLRAGLGPILDRRSLQHKDNDETGEMLATVVYAMSREDPTRALSRRIANAAGIDPPREASVLATIERATERVDRVLIVLDQFEEYLGYADGVDGDSFADDFVRTMTRSELPVHIMIAIREDSISKLDRFRPRSQELMSNPIRIEPLAAAAAREVIDGPIGAYNQLHRTAYRVDDDFASAVIETTGVGMLDLGVGGRGGLEHRSGAIEAAYLQLVLKSVWEAELQNGSSKMTAKTFEKLGGVAGIVRKHVDDIMEKFNHDEQVTAAAAFRYLVTPSGMKVPYSSWDLSEMTHRNAGRIDDVLNRLTSERMRLVRPLTPSPQGHSRYEIYHDRLADPILDWRMRFERVGDRSQSFQRASLAVSALTAVLALATVVAGLRFRLTIEVAAASLLYALLAFAPLRLRENLSKLLMSDRSVKDDR